MAEAEPDVHVTPSSSPTTSACPRKGDSEHYQEESIDDLSLYRLDYEKAPVENDDTSNHQSINSRIAPPAPPQILAAGGEVLQPGDHVYMDCTMYQHHGIVLQVEVGPQQSTSSSLPSSHYSKYESKNKPYILIAEFTNVAIENDTVFTSASTASNAVSNAAGVEGGFRIVREYNASKVWHKVKYNASALECLTWRPGTCSSAQPSSVTTILMRVLFLRDCRHHLIPDYHLLASNCETVAVWCVTGIWQTLQGGRALQLSTLTTATAAAAFGLPGIGASIAVAVSTLWHAKVIGDSWKETEVLLNKEFEWYALGKVPTKFVFE